MSDKLSRSYGVIYLTMSKTQLTCPCCFRKYKMKVYFDRHVSACSLLHQTKKERDDAIETRADTPDIRKLYEMVLALSEKNQALEAKVEELTKWANIRKKRLHVKEWLDEHYQQIETFNSSIAEIQITDEQYDYVCKYDYIEGIIMIFKSLFSIDDEQSLSIKAFDQKDNTFFVKKQDGWAVLSTSELENMISTISKAVMNKFVEWQTKNKHRLHEDSYTDIYTSTLQKVIGGNFTREQSFARIRRGLYKYLKMNLKNVVQFEFMF